MSLTHSISLQSGKEESVSHGVVGEARETLKGTASFYEAAGCLVRIHVFRFTWSLALQ